MAEKYKNNAIKIYLLTALIFCFCYSCSDNRKDNPKDPKERLLNLARKFYKENKYLITLDFLDSIMTKDTTIGEVYYMKGYCEVQLKDHRNASKDYLKAIMLNYRKADAYKSLGLNEIFCFHDISAEFYFKKSIELNPEKPFDVRRVLINGCEERIKRRNDRMKTY